MKENPEKWVTGSKPRPPATDLRSLVDSDVGEMIPQLIPIFLESAAQDIEKMRVALCASDAAALASAAHSLKGSCGNMGASLLQDFCEQIEIHSRAASLDGTSKLLESLALEFDRVRNELNVVLAERPLS